MTLAATGRYAMLTCRPVAERNQRADLRFVRVTGFDEESRMALIWRSGHRRAYLTKLAALLREPVGAPQAPADLFTTGSSRTGLPVHS